jgi:nitrite reductase/ring-hydroxylating ferredoxin subunit/uncharacterized membrane protein
MRSRAHVKTHPLHPALIPFPFAFLSGALAFDLLGLLRTDQALGVSAGYLTVAGLAAGVAAAIPGAIDYLYTVPPRSSAKTRATRHAAGNALALVVFALAFASRGADWQPTALTIGLELLGTIALAYSGWLGGTLVSRNMIGVDHRYANAGRWQEARITARPEDAPVVAAADDLQENQMKLLHLNGERVALARTADGYCAFEDRCTHRGGSLAGGVLINGTVQCLWHGSQFDVRTGRVVCGPAKTPVRTVPVTETADGRVRLKS